MSRDGLFFDDVSRYPVGRVKAYDENCIRIVGYVWVYSTREGGLLRRREKREWVLVLGDKLVINILPPTVSPESTVYATDTSRKMFVTDGKKFSLGISEFVELK